MLYVHLDPYGYWSRRRYCVFINEHQSFFELIYQLQLLLTSVEHLLMNWYLALE